MVHKSRLTISVRNPARWNGVYSESQVTDYGSPARASCLEML